MTPGAVPVVPQISLEGIVSLALPLFIVTVASQNLGVAYIGFGLLASEVTAFAAGAPTLIEAVAGLALLTAFGSALRNALADTLDREAAVITSW